MANQNEVLKVLAGKEGATSYTTIASELNSAQATIQTYLSRLKKKGHVEGGGQEWFITDAGRKALERGEAPSFCASVRGRVARSFCSSFALSLGGKRTLSKGTRLIRFPTKPNQFIAIVTF